MRRWNRVLVLAGLGMIVAVVVIWVTGRPLRVGSKKFTEGVILGEMLSQLMEREGGKVEHLSEMGGTSIVFGALEEGEIDTYAEYTGTLMGEILSRDAPASIEEARKLLADRGIRMSAPLGFVNNYAIGIKRKKAEALGIRRISDLRGHPQLRYAFGHEFMEREDGWPGLKRRYGLEPRHLDGLDHDIAYKALAADKIDVMDVYVTDAEIRYYDLRLLEDDLDYFPSYHALVLYRTELEEERPELVQALRTLEGSITADRMRQMNMQAKIEKRSERAVAAGFLDDLLNTTTAVDTGSPVERILRRTKEHTILVVIPLVAVILLGTLLGILAAKTRWLEAPMLIFVGLMWTIPSLAMFYLGMPLFGIGARPTILALFLYSLLPVVYNTHTGLRSVPRPLAESALVLGLGPVERLVKVEIPLAAPAILAGIRTSGLIIVGTATIGAIIGAGGYGQPILTGLRRDDPAMVLEGTVPAMIMALVLLGLLYLLERVVVSPGLRARS